MPSEFYAKQKKNLRLFTEQNCVNKFSRKSTTIKRSFLCVEKGFTTISCPIKSQFQIGKRIYQR